MPDCHPGCAPVCAPQRRLRTLLALAPALLVVALSIALTGCGGSSADITTKPAAAILAASANAARNATGVHILSQFSAGKKLKVITDLQLAGASGGRARLAFGKRVSETIRIGNTIYVEVGPFLAQRLAQKGAHVSPGTWVKASINDPQMASAALFTKPDGELNFLLHEPTISLTKGPIVTIDRHKAIELKTRGKLYTGAIYVAASGTPYPIEIVEHGQENGQITFTEWGKSVDLTPPANAVELASLERKRS